VKKFLSSTHYLKEKKMRILKVILSSVLLSVALIGVVSVNGCASTATQESMGQAMDSSAITTAIKSKYLVDSDISSLRISVFTFKSRVTLSGAVDNDLQRRKAVSIAEQTKGVVSVKDELVIRH
jgi:osmotically-inducible protein OsmY